MDSAETNARFRVVTVLWLALLVGASLYAAVVWLLVSGVLTSGWTPTLERGQAFPFLALPVLSMVAGIVFRRAAPAGGGGSEEAVMGAYQNRVVVASALVEGGGLLGFTLALLAGAGTWIPFLWLLMAFALFLVRPARDEFDRLLR